MEKLHTSHTDAALLSFGELLKHLRHQAHMTQRDLALATGYSIGQICRFEQNQHVPDLPTLTAHFIPALIPVDDTAMIERLLALADTARAAQRQEQRRPPPVLLAPPEPGAEHPPALVPSHLPIPATPLLGRAHDVAQVCALLQRASVRLLTLTGPGGIGKTRLGLQVAVELLDDIADGAWFVNLAPISDPTLLAVTIAQTLGIKEQAGRALRDSLKDWLREKRLLLLLDNFEQIIVAAPLVSELLAAVPNLKVLVTSRMPLRLSGEQEFVVAPLALPPRGKDVQASTCTATLTQYAAVQLFITRAQAVKADFGVTDATVAAIAEICHCLDGLPLAIELAAARIKLFAPEALLRRLEHRLPLLTGGPRDIPARQQTLRTTIDWSYQLLDPAEQRLFAHLGVFVGGCTLEAAEAVCTAAGDLGEDVLEGLATLVDQSLVRQDEGLDGEPRFVMLETIHEYALEQLVTHGEVEIIQQQHAAYFLALAQEAALCLYGAEQQTWLERLETEHDNLRTVLAWSQMAEDRAEVGARLTGALWWFWSVRGHVSEGRAWLEHALAQSTLSTAARATALLGAGWLAVDQRDSMRAVTLLEESLALHRKLGDQQGVAWSLSFLGRAAKRAAKNGAQAVILLEESLALHRESGDRRGIAWSLNSLGREAWLQHDFMRAAALFEEGLRLFRELGDIRNIAWSLWFLGAVTIEPERAAAFFEESLALHRKLGDHHGLMLVLNRLGWLAHTQGDDRRAKTLFMEVLTLTREGKVNKHAIAWSLHTLGEHERSRGDDAAAGMYYDESLALRRKLLDKQGIAMELHNLGYVAQHQGEYERATALFAQSLSMCQEREDQVGMGECLEGLAGVAAVTRQPKRAARLLGAAETLRNIMRARREPVDQIEYERTVPATRAQLDEATFVAVWAEGKAMPLEQAIAYALNDSD